MSATQSHSATARRSPNDARPPARSPTSRRPSLRSPAQISVAPAAGPSQRLAGSSGTRGTNSRKRRVHLAPSPRSPCAAARKRRVKSPARSRPPAADPRRRTISLGRAPTQRGRRDSRGGARSVRWHAPSRWAVTRIDDQRSSAGARARRPRPPRSLRRRRRCYTSRRAYPRRVTSRPSGSRSSMRRSCRRRSRRCTPWPRASRMPIWRDMSSLSSSAASARVCGTRSRRSDNRQRRWGGQADRSAAIPISAIRIVSTTPSWRRSAARCSGCSRPNGSSVDIRTCRLGAWRSTAFSLTSQRARGGGDGVCGARDVRGHGEVMGHLRRRDVEPADGAAVGTEERRWRGVADGQRATAMGEDED